MRVEECRFRLTTLSSGSSPLDEIGNCYCFEKDNINSWQILDISALFQAQQRGVSATFQIIESLFEGLGDGNMYTLVDLIPNRCFG